jgi:hypothetical protein
MRGDDGSLISELVHDHRRLGELLVRLTTRGAARGRLADEMTSEVVRHVVGEELYLYPVVREVVPEWVLDSTDHVDNDAQMEEMLADLCVTRPDSHAFDSLITRLVVASRQALLHEELEVFPLLARNADRRLLGELGHMFRAFSDAAVVEKTGGAGRVVRFHGLVLHRWEPGLALAEQLANRPEAVPDERSQRDVTPYLSLPA